MTCRMRCIVMSRDTKSRKWNITINNPLDHGFTRDKIKEQLKAFKSCVYWCISDEVGLEGTPHTHIYMALKNGSLFTTVLKRFKGGHIEMAKGTSQQNRDYTFKEGPKWENDEKEGTNLRNTHEEWGEMPIESQGKRNDLEELYKMVESGMSDADIIKEMPSAMVRIDSIRQTRQVLIEDEFKNTFREIETTYVFGKTGTGKTRDIMERYGYSNVFRVTDYEHPFDGYKNQDVIMFDEFRSSLKVSDMLVYLDGYPVELPSRYANKIACFTKIYVVSNWDLTDQYSNVQDEHLETWKAFLRRVDFVKQYTGTDKIKKGTTEYLSEPNFTEIKADPEVVKAFEKQSSMN